jgi:hypothetical protein
MKTSFPAICCLVLVILALLVPGSGMGQDSIHLSGIIDAGGKKNAIVEFESMRFPSVLVQATYILGEGERIDDCEVISIDVSHGAAQLRFH